MKKYDLIVVGGGVLGAFHAFHALKMGLSVALFEKNSQPQGATVRNFGQVVPSGLDSKRQKMGRRSVEIYKDIQSKMDISLRQNGSTYLASNDEELTLLEELAAINLANGYESHLMTAHDCLEKFDGLRSDYVRGGLFFPQEITLEPRVAIARILAYLVEKEGLAYFPNTQIEDVNLGSTGCHVVASDARRFSSEKVIICSGAEFKTLFPKIFNESDIEVSKIHMLETVPQPRQRIRGSILSGLSIRRYESFSECPSWAAIKKNERSDTLEKKFGVHILFKQTASGSIIIGDSHEYADAKNADDLGFDVRFDMNECIIENAKAIFDLENWQMQRTWFGIYPQCKTQDVFLHDIENRIHITTAIGGKGMTMSAGFAEENLRRIYAGFSEPIGNPLTINHL